MKSKSGYFILEARLFKVLAFSFLFLSSTFTSFSQVTFDIKQSDSIFPLGHYVYLYEDKNSSLKFEDIVSEKYKDLFKLSTVDVPNFNVSQSAYWCRLTVHNSTTNTKWYFEELLGSIGSIEYFQIINGKTKHLSAGLMHPLSDRKPFAVNPIFPLILEKDSTSTVYFRLTDNAPFCVNLNVGKLERYFERNHVYDSLNGIYFGMMFILLVYNLFIYFSVKERSYIYYVFYILFTCIFSSFLTGYIVHLPKPFLSFFKSFPAIVPCLFGLFAMLFTANFLVLKKNSPPLYTFVKIMIVVVFLNMILAFAGWDRTALLMVQSCGLILCLYAITAGIVVLKKGYKPALYYLIAWGIYMVAIMVYLLSDLGVIKYNMFTHSSLQLGSAFEAILLSLALANKVSVLKSDKEEAQENVIQAARENERLIREQNVVLEEKVKERTQELEEKNKEIIDSIHYARRIQSTLLAHTAFLKQHMPYHFILFKPKDIVSGDFYWATLREDKFYVAVCDSTGHGVPGAFMSLLNTSFLNEAINEKNILEPNEIFNYSRKRLIESISQDGGKDGMDGILVCVDKKNNKITYSAANNAPLLIRNVNGKKELIYLKVDKMPVGKGETTHSFSLNEIELQKGDTVYLFTDGYADQFGGPKGKKFMYKQLEEIFYSISDEPLEEQRETLDKAFEKWKGDLEQIDDVLIMGIRI